MRNAVHATAPGKLVLAGEYAVLEGAPALAVAVDARASAAIRAEGRGGDHAVLHIANTGREFGFVCDQGKIVWIGDEPRENQP